MPVILVIQIAGESLFSVSSVFQELFSIKWSPSKRKQDANKSMFSYYALHFHHENAAISILTKTKWNLSLLKPWLTYFLIVLILECPFCQLCPHQHTCTPPPARMHTTTTNPIWHKILATTDLKNKSVLWFAAPPSLSKFKPCHFNLRY